MRLFDVPAYSDLARRPDGKGQHAIVPYLQAAIRLYMSVCDVSQIEYQAVLRRLRRTARTAAMGHTCRNYVEVLYVEVLRPAMEADVD